jgi:acyl-coenzyme A thioesterase PaaI-like protein
MSDSKGNEPLRPHAPACFGCGADNPAGLGLKAYRIGDEIHGEVTFSKHHSGAPTFAHGGAVATAIDDCLGFVLYVVGEPAVTAHLEVDYRKPVLLGVRYTLLAKVDGRDGRKVYASIVMREPDGDVAAEGQAIFVTVSVEHFMRELTEEQIKEATERGVELPW